MAQGLMLRDSSSTASSVAGAAALSPTGLGGNLEEKFKLMSLFDGSGNRNLNSNTVKGIMPSNSTALLDMTASNLDLALLGATLTRKTEDQLRPTTDRKKLKQRFRPISDASPVSDASSDAWSETVPINTKESVMGPLESFLRSINCYPEHEQNRKKEAAQKERRKYHAKSNHPVPLLQATLPPPPPLGDGLDNCGQSSNTEFSWTPSLLNQRRPPKSQRNTNGDSHPVPEKDDRKNKKSDHDSHSV